VRVRGVIEGFYGTPWSHAERLDLLEFCAHEGFDTWVHAPKDDSYHRARWREPYPERDLERFAELVETAGRLGVEFIYAIAPGLSICCSLDAELEALAAKCEQLRGAGVRRFHLLFDDLEQELNCAEDEARYGHEARPGAAAHADLANRFRRAVPQDAPLVVCPRGYAGVERTDYREVFGRLLDPGIVVYWTGPEVVPATIAREDLDEAATGFAHELLLWDNYPVNDFDPERLFLGPLRGRDPELAEGRLAGLVANGMLQAVPQKLPLATVADYVRDPAGYDPAASFERALRTYGAEVVEALRALASGSPGQTAPPDDLVEALAPGVDAATALAYLEPHA
jgi:hyaluronoglucosaminidase